MPKWQLALLIVLVALGFVGFVIGLTQLSIAADDEGIRSQVLLTIEDGETLRVETTTGRIDYAAWDGDQVRIEALVRARALTNAQARRYVEQVQVDVGRTADGVTAIARPPDNLSLLNVVSVDFVVRVPEAWRGRVELRTTEGPITAVDLHGDAMVETTTGPITIRSHTGSLQVSSANGAIDVDDSETVLTASTANGTIVVNGGVLHGQGSARTQNGSVRIRAGLAEAAALQVHTTSGNVAVYLEAPDVAMDLATTYGRVRLHGDAAATVQQPDKFVGRVGRGASELVARSSNGSIDVYLLDDAL